eukprot:461467_1
MIILITYGVGNIITIAIENSDTIENVKQKIQQQNRIPIARQHLFILTTYTKPTHLQNNQTVATYDIKNEMTLYLLVSSQNNATIIFARHLTTLQWIILDVSLNENIQSVKAKIADKTGVRASQQRLIYTGKLLDDERT